MFPKTYFAGITIFIIGSLLLLLTGIGYLPDTDYLFGVGIAVLFVGIFLLGLGGNKLTQKSKLLIAPIIYTIIWNLGVVYLFITMDRQLFNDFVHDYGLTGTWSLFTLNMHANINGTILTYPYINSHIVNFLLCVIGNIVLSAIFMTRIYRANEKQSIPPPP